MWDLICLRVGIIIYRDNSADTGIFQGCYSFTNRLSFGDNKEDA